jgi:alpha-glucosidase
MPGYSPGQKSYMKKAVFLSLILFFAWASPLLATDTVALKSPDGKTRLTLFQKNRQLCLGISAHSKTVLLPSPLEFSIDGQSLTREFQILKTERYNIKDQFSLWGAHEKAVNQGNGVRISMGSNSKKSIWQLDIRVYNEGIAFRQVVPSSGQNRTPQEFTVFNFPQQSAIWYHDLEMHYEGVHVKKKMEEVGNGEWMAPPVTIQLPGGAYAAISEANLAGYPGMALQGNGKSGLVMKLAHEQRASYPYRLRYSAEDTLRLMQAASIQGIITTPWRVLLLAKDLNALVNNDLIAHLNPPPDPELFPLGLQTSWLKPGRAVWKYLNGGGDGTLAVMKHFTDGAAALGFEHNILEGFWSRWPQEDLEELVRYSKEKGVGIWLWKHSKSLRNPLSRDSFFRKCQALGIAGVKIDFFDHEAKEVIDLYEDILKESARYKLMLDFHGSNKPTGQARTYPNELVRESVKGMEASKLLDRAAHQTTIPFTRWLAGPGEYTVVHFGERRKNTSWAHQLASAAILNAPLLTYAAHPDTLLAHPAVELIKSIPANWDETRVLLPSAIGELAVFARRKGKDWFLAVMNGNRAQKISIPLQFLQTNAHALMALDGMEPASVNMQKKTFSPGAVLELDLAPGGGFLGRFQPGGQ